MPTDLSARSRLYPRRRAIVVQRADRSAFALGSSRDQLLDALHGCRTSAGASVGTSAGRRLPQLRGSDLSPRSARASRLGHSPSDLGPAAAWRSPSRAQTSSSANRVHADRNVGNHDPPIRALPGPSPNRTRSLPTGARPSLEPTSCAKGRARSTSGGDAAAPRPGDGTSILPRCRPPQRSPWFGTKTVGRAAATRRELADENVCRRRTRRRVRQPSDTDIRLPEQSPSRS